MVYLRVTMLKIRALNEPQSSSESEDEDCPRLSKEAQESQAISLYNEALCIRQKGDVLKALESFKRLVDLPYLNDDDRKSFSPLQLQIRIGCLKCLGSLYSHGITKDLKGAITVLLLITELEPTNVNNWYRLGKAAMEDEDFDLAFNSFQYSLRLSPNHWGSIDKLVTLAYVRHDLFMCLYYCALGLAKDSGFVKGSVFKDYIFKSNPWIKTVLELKKANFESLFAAEKQSKYEETAKFRFLEEARRLIIGYRQRKTSLRKQEVLIESSTIVCPFFIPTLTLVNLCNVVNQFGKYLKEHVGTFLRPIDLRIVLKEQSCSEDLINNFIKDTDCETDDYMDCQNSMLRSRSSSDDKDMQVNDVPDVNGSSAEDGQKDAPDNDEKSTDGDLQPARLQQNGNPDEDNYQRKKSRRGLQWWQFEGKRRSQRVRGNLVPCASGKPKAESSFLELLKNILPSTLIMEDSSQPKDKEDLKSVQESTKSRIHNSIYFGTSEEEKDVKEFIADHGLSDIITVISKLTLLLSRRLKGAWPPDLSDSYLELCDFYRSTTVQPNPFLNLNVEERTDSLSDRPLQFLDEFYTVEADAFLMLTRRELLSEAGSTCAKVNFEAYKLMGQSFSSFKVDVEFELREKWLAVKEFLAQDTTDNKDYSASRLLLNSLLNELKSKPSSYICYVPTQISNIISTAEVQLKLSHIQKLENLNRINDLYAEKNYEALVDILEFSISVDSKAGDYKSYKYLAESYFYLDKIECIEQCSKLCEYGIKNNCEEALCECLCILLKAWNKLQGKFTIKEHKAIVNVAVQILTNNERKEEYHPQLSIEPWYILHSVVVHLEQKEPEFFLEEDSVPNSILLLQMGHEVLSRSGKCCAENGKFLLHTIDALLPLLNLDEYWHYDETRTCFEQAIYCVYSHPAKKFKVKNLKDHCVEGISLNWNASCHLFQYYRLESLPEFDSYDSISVEVEHLFQRIIEEIPKSAKPSEGFVELTEFVEGKCDSIPTIQCNFPSEISCIYYLLADYHFKSKNFSKAVEFYIWDLVVCPYRFDSWAAIALAKAEDIVSQLNSCNRFSIEDIILKADAVVNCFKSALKLDETNVKVRIEFGSFLYSLHSVYSRELKFHTDQLSLEMFDTIERKKNEYLLEAEAWFEPLRQPKEEDQESQNEEVWINHYMLGKVTEKLHPNDFEKYLKQYEIAGKLLHEQGAPYPGKINYYNAPEFALEALEIYYRIHASILNYVEKNAYDAKVEEVLLSIIERAENSPFIKLKKGGDTGEIKKRKTADDSLSKKDQAEIANLLSEIVSKVEEQNIASNSESGSDSVDSASTAGEDSIDQEAISKSNNTRSQMSNFSLSAFQEKMREKDLRHEQLAEQARISKEKETRTIAKEGLMDIVKSVPDNPFFPDFSNLQYGEVISRCMKAMKETVARYPQSFKSYFRLAYTFKTFNNDLTKAREYLLGNYNSKDRKIMGLYGERKPNNFFNGIWRNPVDDIDRPGSFPFHMAKSMQLLLNISRGLNDHNILAELGLQLAKVPDSQNAYLFTEDREQFSKEAIRFCVIAAKKSISCNSSNLKESCSQIYETYLKFQKHNPKENIISPVLLEAYKVYAKSQYPEMNLEMSIVPEAVRFFQQEALSSRRQAQGFVKNNIPGKSLFESNGMLYQGPSMFTNRNVKLKSNETSVYGNNSLISSLSKDLINSASSSPKPPIPGLLSPADLSTILASRNLSEQDKMYMKYASELSNYFCSLNPSLTALSSPIVSQSMETNTHQAEGHSQGHQSNHINFSSFNSDSVSSVHHLLSNVSKAIAATSTCKSQEQKAESDQTERIKSTLPTAESVKLATQLNPIRKSTDFNSIKTNQSRTMNQVPTNTSNKQAAATAIQSTIHNPRKNGIGTKTPYKIQNSHLELEIISDGITNYYPKKTPPWTTNQTVVPTLRKNDRETTNQVITKNDATKDLEIINQITHLNSKKNEPSSITHSISPLSRNSTNNYRPPQTTDYPKAQTPNSTNAKKFSPVQGFCGKSPDYLKPKKILDTIGGSGSSQTYNGPMGLTMPKGDPKELKSKGVPIQVARKSTSYIRDSNQTFPSVGAYPLIKTSPFQTQTTAILKPSISSLSSGNRLDNSCTRTPPAAHSQQRHKSTFSSLSENEPVVVDLTTKSPEKSSPADRGTPMVQKTRPVKRPLPSSSLRDMAYSLPPKKKHIAMLSSPVPVSAPQPDADFEVITLE